MKTQSQVVREAAQLLRVLQNRMGASRPTDPDDAKLWNDINRCCSDLRWHDDEPNRPCDASCRFCGGSGIKHHPGTAAETGAVGVMGDDGKIHPVPTPGLTREQYEGLGFGKPGYPS